MENKVVSRKMVLLLEKWFLGNLKLSTIDVIWNGGVYGVFRISKPIVIFGYSNITDLKKIAKVTKNTS